MTDAEREALKEFVETCVDLAVTKAVAGIDVMSLVKDAVPEPSRASSCATCGDVGLLPERAMGDPQGQMPCPQCPAGTAMAAQIAAVARCVESIIGKTIDSLPTPRDGKDGRDGTDGKDGAPGERGQVGPAGEHGKAGEKGLDGKDGTGGSDGKDGRDGLHGKDGRDGIATRDELNELVKAGIDGLGAELKVELKAFNLAEIGKLPVIRFAGSFKEGQIYTPGQTVRWGGDLWYCNAETGLKPGGNDDWTLMVRKGRDFRPPDRK